MREYDKLNEAVLLDRDAALKSASSGLFQIMGFNYKAAGFESVGNFVEAMKISEGDHLKAFCKFVQSKKIDQVLRHNNWQDNRNSASGI